MTLLPIDNRRVRGVSAERYPLNTICSHPECDKPADDPHHIFRRTAIGNSLWFVEITHDDLPGQSIILPHVVGLCREHHDLVTVNDSWIRLEDDEFVWYDELKREPLARWERVGALDPQPAGRDKVRKPKRKKLQGEERRKRKTISLRVPDDSEDGAAIWDEVLEEVKAKLVRDGLYSENDRIPIYEALIAALRDWLNG